MAIGAAGLQALNAQAKPKGYTISIIEVIDEAAFKEFLPKVTEANKAAGGKYLVRGGRIAALIGTPPKRVTVHEYATFEQAANSQNGPAWQAIKDLQKKAVKSHAFAVEGLQ
jgi:uncharacterized protein (DUF1330 family)